MADSDDTNTHEMPGGGLPGAAAAVGGAYVGGLTASHLMAHKDTVDTQLKAAKEAETKASGEHEVKVNKLLEKDPALIPLRDAFDQTQLAEVEKKIDYIKTVTAKWGEEIKTLPPEKIAKLQLAQLEASEKDLKSLIPSATRDFLREANQESIKAVKAEMAKDTFAKLTPDEALTAIGKAQIEAGEKLAKAKLTPEELKDAASAYAFLEKKLGDMETVLEQLNKKNAHENMFAAMSRAEPQLGEKIAKSGEVVKAKTEMEAATKAFKVAETNWAPKLAEAGATELKAAKEAVQKLTALEAINTEKKFLSRPFKIFSHVSGTKKFAIIATAVGLGTAAYAGVRSMRNSKAADAVEQQPASFTERQDQAKAAVADQSVGRSA